MSIGTTVSPYKIYDEGIFKHLLVKIVRLLQGGGAKGLWQNSLQFAALMIFCLFNCDVVSFSTIRPRNCQTKD
jgi:hypothetical protein